MSTLRALLLLLSTRCVVDGFVLEEYRIGDETTIERQLLYVREDDVQQHSQRIAKHISIGSAVVFEDCNPKVMSSILQDAAFPSSPTDQVQMVMVHWYRDDRNFKIYHLKEYDHFTFINETIYSDDGTETRYNATDKGSIQRGSVFDDYISDVMEYAKYCVTGTVDKSCSEHMTSWNTEHGFSDQNGMQPTNRSAVWGQIETHLYYQGYDSFNSLIPFSVYIYADANPATLELESIVVYMIAEGIHSQNQSDPSYCNTDGCRGIFHREMVIDVNAKPKAAFTQDTYYWIFSTPHTANQKTTVTTSFSQTETQGQSATFKEDGDSITFSSSISESRSYSRSEQISDFVCDELTNGADTVGSWHYYQAEPVNIVDNPLTNFHNDWKEWYSKRDDPCAVVDGPDLAAATMYTSDAIKWWAHPDLIDYKNRALEMDYFVSAQVEQDHIWCPGWHSHPGNPCNHHGKKHHCAQHAYAGMGPSHTANVIQAMNNIH